MVWTFAQYRGIPLRLHISMAIILPLIASGVGGENLFVLIEAIGRSVTELNLPPLLVGCAIAFGLFLSILGHELGHALVAQRRGAQVKGITILLLGGITQIERKGIGTAQDAFRIAVAGPLVNIAFGLLSLLIARILSGSLDAVLVFTIVGSANLFIAAFNLIPAFPLDGGRILEAVLWGRLGRNRGIQIASSVGRFVALFCGFFALLNGMLLLLMLAGFMYLGATAQRHLASLSAKDNNLPNQITEKSLQPVVTLSEYATLGDAVQLLRQEDCLVALVKSVKGRLLGIVELERLVDSGHDYLRDLPLKRIQSVHLGEASVVERRASTDWYLVYDEYNVLLGVTRAHKSS